MASLPILSRGKLVRRGLQKQQLDSLNNYAGNTFTFCHILPSKSRSTLPDPSVSNSLPQCKVRISIARDMGSLPSISLRIRQRVLKSSTCPADRHPQLAHNDAERLYKLTRFDKHEIASF